MKVSGALLIILGFLIAMRGLFMSGAAGFSDTLNIGLLNDKSGLVGIGCAGFVSGSVFVAAAAIIEALKRTSDVLIAQQPVGAEIDSGAF